MATASRWAFSSPTVKVLNLTFAITAIIDTIAAGNTKVLISFCGACLKKKDRLLQAALTQHGWNCKSPTRVRMAAIF